MVEIDKGVPVPEAGIHGGTRKYPWVEMVIGDSFLCPLEIKSARAIAAKAAKRHQRIFVVRLTAQGARVWRIA